MCTAVKIFCLGGSPWIEAGSKEGPDSSGGESRKVPGEGEARDPQLLYKIPELWPKFLMKF